MDARFNELYRILFDLYGRDASARLWITHTPFSNIVRSVLEPLFEEPNTVSLRSDAQFFLLINFDLMIGAPLQASEFAGRPSIAMQQLSSIIEDDARLIIQEARREAAASSEVTAIDVLRSVAAVYPRLKSKKADLWG